MKNKFIVLIIIIFISVFLYSCQSNAGTAEAVTVKFNEDFKYEKYNGKEVTIRGYMSTLSPMDGKFIYLMNIPYQSCPFCLPNSTTIVNTIAIYAPSGQRFDFYDGPVEITGTVEAGDTVDDFGYQYPFKIVNAKYTKIDTAQLSENLKIYGALSQDGIINDIVVITNQVDFNAFFEMYGQTSDDIEIVNDSEFEDIARRINGISSTEYDDILAIVEGFKEYNEKVNANIEMGEYEKNCSSDMEKTIVDLLDNLYTWLNKFEI